MISLFNDKMKQMTVVNNLRKIFRTKEIETTALNEVSFEVKKGELVAIMRPSDCGKSTLLNILGLQDKVHLIYVMNYKSLLCYLDKISCLIGI